MLESRGNSRQGSMANDMRARHVDEAGWLGGGENPWKANPGRGCGMKQAHEAVEGENRRGRVKRRGRTVGRGWDPDRKWISTVHAAMGSRTPRKALAAFVRRAGSRRSYSEEEAKLTRG